MSTLASTLEDRATGIRQPLASRTAEVLLIVLVYLVAAGDPPPNVNEAHYLCRLKHYWNPAWCAGDLFLESTDTQVVVIWMMGWMTRWFSLAATAWIGRLIVWTLLAWAWQRFSWRLVPTQFAAVLSAALFVTLNLQAHLAGEWVVGGVEAKCFAYSLVLVALQELVDGRWNRVWMLLGAAMALHPLAGGWSALVCGGLWLLVGRQEAPLFSMWRGAVVAALLAAPGVVPALSLTWNQPPEAVAQASRIYVFERLPHHLALLSLPGEEFSRRLFGHVVLWAVLAVFAWILRGHPVRQVILFAAGAALIASLGLLIEVSLAYEPQIAARLLRYYWYRLTDFATPLAVSQSATVVVVTALAGRKPWALGALLAIMLYVGGQLASIAYRRTIHPIPPADARMASYQAWVDVCDWIAANTPSNARFLTPRLCQSFKWRTGRPEVATRKDVPQDTPGILEWDRRIKDIYYYQSPAGLQGPIDSVGRLGDERVRALAQRYGAQFVLSDRGQLLSLPRAYWNDEYVVYRIDE